MNIVSEVGVETSVDENLFFDLLENKKIRYDDVPRPVKLSWIVLSKVILRLASVYEDFRNYGEYMYLNCLDKDGKYIAKSKKAVFFENLFPFLGELPLDTSTTFGDGVVGHREVELLELKRSSNTREEQLLCLELLVARCWHDLFVKKLSNSQCRFKQYQSLEYLYWECSIDNNTAMLWDSEPDINDAVFNETRRILYRKLYELQMKGELSQAMQQISHDLNNFDELLASDDYKPARNPRPIKKRRTNGVLAGFNANAASMRGVRGRPGPLNPMRLWDSIPIGMLLEHVKESYPIQV